MAGRRYSIEATIGAADRVTKPVLKMSKAVRKFARTASTSLSKANRTVNALGSGVKRAAMAFSAAALIVGAAGANITRTGMEFEQSIVSASAKFGGTAERGTAAFYALETAARAAGKTTEFTASQSAEALNFLAMAGFSAEASIAALPAVVDLATAANVDLARSTDIASDAMGAFGLASKDAVTVGKNLARINDVIAKTTTTANLNMEDFFESMKDGAPVATAAGASIETYSALLGTMANAGIKGSKAGTTLKNMFLRLQAPTSTAAKMMRNMGVVTRDSQGNMRDIISILGDVDKATKSLGTADKAKIMNEIFGMRAIAGANILLSSGAKNLNAYRKQLEGAQGASKNMAATMRDTVSGQIKTLQSSIESVKLSIFDMNKGPLSDLINRMTEWVRANEKLITQKVGDFIAGIGKAIAFMVKHRKALGTAVAVLMSMAIAVKVLTGVMMIMNIVMMANPIGLIIAGIVLLVGFITLLTIKWNEWGAAVSLMLGPVGILISMIKTFKKNWQGIVDAFKSDGIKAGILSIGKTILDAVLMPLEQVYKLMSKIPGMKKLAGNAASNIAALREKLVVESGSTEAATAPQMVTPQERVARTIEESRSSSSAEVTIRDETGRAELSGGSLGAGINLMSSGAFAQ